MSEQQSPASVPAADRQPTFEEAMARLEAIVSEMERGNIPLEKMIEKYEAGAKLAKYCQDKLASLKKKMEILSASADGSTEWREMTEKESSGPRT